MTTGKLLSDWAVAEIKEHYSEDVALLINHTTLQLPEDVEKSGFSFYIPLTNRANGLARTFIIDGIGYDLFPMSWERLESMADMKNYNATCLADIIEEDILYCGDEAALQRFYALQAKQRANLKNPDYMLARAEEWLESACQVLAKMITEPQTGYARMKAGHVCDMLALAVAYANQSYFPHGQTSQLQELQKLANVPQGFLTLYQEALLEQDPLLQARSCRKLAMLTEEFLKSLRRERRCTPDYQELASWYAELAYTWRRVAYWCDQNDPVNAYLWSCYLQDEARSMGERFSIQDTDFMAAYNPANLAAYKARTKEVEQNFISAIEGHGVAIDRYASVEDFLEMNRRR